ncbi:MAG: gamma-glutamyltransferase [Gammaproteobacteria bacterium]
MRRTSVLPVFAASGLLSLFAGCAAQAPDSRPSPPPPSPVVTPEASPNPDWRSGAMVAAANPMAVDAGLEVLRRGGSAVDAAIAVQAVLGLVEPQSSGIGGGAFMLHYSAKTGDVVAYDGREVAPKGATPELFLDSGGQPLPFFRAQKSGRSTGVPGAVAMLEMAHREHGRLPWAAGWQPAIRLASEGFPVPPRLAALIRQADAMDPLSADARAYLMPRGEPLAEGQRLHNEAYADTLRRIAREGARGFYTGPVAAAMVAAAAEEPLPGTLSLDDLRSYRPQRLEPLCGTYRVWKVCGMRPPSSGGVAVLATLGILGNFDLAASGPDSVRGWHLFIEAQRLAYADRDMYVADDRFVQVPLAGLLDPDYLRVRASEVMLDRAQPMVTAGRPPGAEPRAPDSGGGFTGTSHFVIVDAAGDVVSMTTTVESVFGSQRAAGGFFLNNQLTDFSFRAVGADGLPIANAPAAGKKPRSSMSPTLVFRDGRFELAVGSPGGNAIISYVSKALVGMLDWNLTPQQAIDLPNVVARNAVVAEGRLDPALREGLVQLGHVFGQGRGAEGSGLHAIRVLPDGRLVGGADSRRDGVARSP